MKKLLTRCGAAGFLLTEPFPGVAQTLGHGAESGPPIWRVLLALTICLALAVGGALALRWRMRGGGLVIPTMSGRRVMLLERTRLSHQVDLCLVRCDGREFLITTSPTDTRFGPELTPAATSDGDDDAI